MHGYNFKPMFEKEIAYYQDQDDRKCNKNPNKTADTSSTFLYTFLHSV